MGTIRTLKNIFRKLKDRPAENQVKGIVYKVQCRSCSFNYIGESKRSWSSRGAEHKPGTRAGNFSAVKEHAETKHDIYPKYAELLERNGNNQAKRLFLEAMHSEKDANAVNEHIPFPIAYRPLLDCMN